MHWQREKIPRPCQESNPSQLACCLITILFTEDFRLSWQFSANVDFVSGLWHHFDVESIVTVRISKTSAIQAIGTWCQNPETGSTLITLILCIHFFYKDCCFWHFKGLLSLGKYLHHIVTLTVLDPFLLMQKYYIHTSKLQSEVPLKSCDFPCSIWAQPL